MQILNNSVIKFSLENEYSDRFLVNFPTRKTVALLVYLAIEGRMQPREHLAALLWPESNPERSHANLRNTLGHLQKTLH
jgi:DNA-binding SARP family transcriptional activator